MKRRRIAIVLALAATFMTGTPALASRMGRVDPETLREAVYSPEGDAFVRRNGDRFNNRPLYCNQTSAIVVAGDRPLIRFGGSVLNGTFMAALVRGQKAKWLHDWSDITSKYRPDRMEWILKDAGVGVTVVTFDAVPPADGVSMAVRLRIENAQPVCWSTDFRALRLASQSNASPSLMVASDTPGHNFFRRLICPRTTAARTCFSPVTGAATPSPPCSTPSPWRGSPVSTRGRGSPCARPQTLIKGQPGARIELTVTFEAGRRHLPVVTLRRVA
jgi:hypothetical protein